MNIQAALAGLSLLQKVVPYIETSISVLGPLITQILGDAGAAITAILKIVSDLNSALDKIKADVAAKAA